MKVWIVTEQSVDYDGYPQGNADVVLVTTDEARARASCETYLNLQTGRTRFVVDDKLAYSRRSVRGHEVVE